MFAFDANLVIAICFILFLYLAYRPLRKTIINSLNSKIKQIEDKLTETAKLKKEAEELLFSIKQEMEKFEQKRENILANAKTSTENLIDTRIKESELMLNRKKDSAIKSIEYQKEKASEQMRSEFSEHLLKLVKTYLAETNNNQQSEEELIKYFIQSSSKTH